jgi:hypothetical protein
MTSRVTRCICVVVATCALAACGGGKKGSAPRPRVTTTTTVVVTTTAPPAPAMTVAPNTGLIEGQAVLVTGTGFPPTVSLNLEQCVDRGVQTTPGDCNVAKLLALKADAQGNVSSPYTVTKGPFGTRLVTCNPAQQCVLTLFEAGSNAPASVTRPIQFATP